MSELTAKVQREKAQRLATIEARLITLGARRSELSEELNEIDEAVVDLREEARALNQKKFKLEKGNGQEGIDERKDRSTGS